LLQHFPYRELSICCLAQDETRETDCAFAEVRKIRRRRRYEKQKEVLEVESQAEEREQEHKGEGGGRIDGGMGREHEIDSSEDTVADDKSGAARWRGMDAEEEGGVHGADQVHGDEQSQRQRLVPHCAERRRHQVERQVLVRAQSAAIRV